MAFRLSVRLNVRLRCSRAILHGLNLYPDPEEFKPERFPNKDGTVRDDPTLPLGPVQQLRFQNRPHQITLKFGKTGYFETGPSDFGGRRF